MGLLFRIAAVIGINCVILCLAAEGVLHAPRLIGVKCENTYVRIEWEPMGDYEPLINRFLIQYNTSHNPDIWQLSADNIPADKQRFEVSVSPWIIYTFRVVAVDSMGRSLPSNHSERCQAPADAPFSNPEEVKGEGNEPNNLVISWKPMPPMKQNGPAFFYRVSWRIKDDSAVWNRMDVYDWQRNSSVVSNVATYVPFDIKVEAFNMRGQASVPVQVVTGYSGEDVPLERPRNVTLVNVIDAHSAIVKWAPVDPSSIRGHFKGYKIQTWTAAEGIDQLMNVSVSPNSTEIHIVTLKPFSENLVRVLAFNGKYDGPHSDVLSIVTPEGKPGPVQKLDVYPMDIGFRLAWKEPLVTNGILTSYFLYIEDASFLIKGKSSEKDPIILEPGTTKTKVVGLNPDTKYRLVLRASTSIGRGDPFYIEATTRNNSSTPPDKPEFNWQLMETLDANTTVKVTWIPDLNGNPGSAFYVEYKKQDEMLFQRTDNIVDEDSVFIDMLEPENIYQMRVVAINGNSTTASDFKDVSAHGFHFDIFQEYLRMYVAQIYSVLKLSP